VISLRTRRFTTGRLGEPHIRLDVTRKRTIPNLFQLAAQLLYRLARMESIERNSGKAEQPKACDSKRRSEKWMKERQDRDKTKE
jgi:hypothetical protein